MAMRLSGLMSGMDTESIIQQLVSAKKTKVDKTKKAQTKLSWKQDAWKELNTKLKNLQSKYLNNMRFTSAYSKKTTKVSNSNAVSVITGEDAVNGVQSLEIRKLAKTGYLTGAQLSTDGKYTAMSTMEDLGVTTDGTFTVKNANTSVDIKISKDTTISDVLSKLKSAGLNASFDEKWQRFNISSPKSGAANDFSITAADAGGNAAMAALGIQTDIGSDRAAAAEYMKYASYVGTDDTETKENLKSLIDASVKSRMDSYLEKYKKLAATQEEAVQKKTDLEDKYKDNAGWLEADYDALLDGEDGINKQIQAQEEKIKQLTESGADADDVREAEKALIDLQKQAAELADIRSDKLSYEAQVKNIADADKAMQDIKGYVDITETPTVDENGKTVISYGVAGAKDKLVKEEEQAYLDKANYAVRALENYEQNVDGSYKTDADGNLVLKSGAQATGNATKVSGQDAEIYLNGARYTNSDNTFKINGLTFTALNETAKGEQITVTTEQDTDGIYDMVKNFLKEYNSIINEMDKLYNADSSKGYEPLTTEEKDALSDREIEEYEKKIKDALLRRDENLNSVSSAMKSVMSAGIAVGGKTMYLADFGIETLGYFEAADNERNAYHIAGDPDDSSSAGKDDVLKSMIANDPNTVISFFTNLSRNLYDKMSELSRGQDGYRSFGSFYDDKKMKSDYDSYTSKIKEQEKKLNEYEDKWYKKFAAMETALAKMQNSANAVTSLLGGS